MTLTSSLRFLYIFLWIWPTLWHPHFFGRSVYPISIKGAEYAHQIILAPPNFQTFRWPCCVCVGGGGGAEKETKYSPLQHLQLLFLHYQISKPSAGTSMYLKESVLLRFSDWMFTVVAKLAPDPS